MKKGLVYCALALVLGSAAVQAETSICNKQLLLEANQPTIRRDGSAATVKVRQFRNVCYAAHVPLQNIAPDILKTYGIGMDGQILDPNRLATLGLTGGLAIRGPVDALPAEDFADPSNYAAIGIGGGTGGRIEDTNDAATGNGVGTGGRIEDVRYSVLNTAELAAADGVSNAWASLIEIRVEYQTELGQEAN